MNPKARIFLVYGPIGLGIALAAMLAGVLLMDWVVMPLLVGKHRGHSIVPNVVSLSVREARLLIEDERLKMQLENELYSDLIEEGKIASQRPAAGREVKRGRTIYYSVSKGSEVVSIPVLRHKTLRQAQLTLRNLKLKTGTVDYAFDDSIPTDCIVSCMPDSGTPVARETEVDLLVSQGPKPTRSLVPNLIGLPLYRTVRGIEKAGLQKGRISYVVRPELAPQTVVSQSLSPGSKAPLGSRINLTVSKPR